jgi:hypothetical protein
MLGRLCAGDVQQPDHLRHPVENGAAGFDSGKPVLRCALRGQPSNMAQGRGLLKIARLEDETVENRRLHALRIARLRFLRVTSGRRKGKIKIKVKGSGRECPALHLHRYCRVWLDGPEPALPLML